MNTLELSSDPIVAEIHLLREILAEQYQNDLQAYSQAAESHCRALGFEIVKSPRRPAVKANISNVEIAV
ncbi:MAG TPA: hypothetical protein V6C58_10280 [Allocoleopsis sp.]